MVTFHVILNPKPLWYYSREAAAEIYRIKSDQGASNLLRNILSTILVGSIQNIPGSRMIPVSNIIEGSRSPMSTFTALGFCPIRL